MLKKRTATFYLAIVMVLVFILNVAVGGGNRFWIFLTGGGYIKEYGEVALSLMTEQGQWWRLLTAFLWCFIFPEGQIVGASLGIFVLLGMLCVELFAKGEKQTIALSRYEKGYLVFYVVAGCFLGIGTIVVHGIGFVIGILAGLVFGRLRAK
ncbi:MAG: hypothetical protein E7268_02345 [Lachnospiraceae bacterium]|nr:hypothetical protein [Lachnospiraceae bacterium]